MKEKNKTRQQRYMERHDLVRINITRECSVVLDEIKKIYPESSKKEIAEIAIINLGKKILREQKPRKTIHDDYGFSY